MKDYKNNFRNRSVIAFFFLLSPFSVFAQQSNEELAKAVQNPLASMISIPFQNNTNFNYGPDKSGTQNILNIQPVVPLADGRIITRTIFPLLWQPQFESNSSGSYKQTSTNMGLADVNFTAFYAPKSKGVVWGIGPIITIPTGYTYSTHNWGIGPSFVLLKITKKFTFGGLINNIWSITNNEDGQSFNNFLLQPFINYNFPGGKGWYLSFSPIITANWLAESGQQWIVPLGLAGGKIVRLGKLPLNCQTGAYYNVIRPDYGPEWQLRFQIAILLPSSILKGGAKK